MEQNIAYKSQQLEQKTKYKSQLELKNEYINANSARRYIKVSNWTWRRKIQKSTTKQWHKSAAAEQEDKSHQLEQQSKYRSQQLEQQSKYKRQQLEQQSKDKSQQLVNCKLF